MHKVETYEDYLRGQESQEEFNRMLESTDFDRLIEIVDDFCLVNTLKKDDRLAPRLDFY